MEELGCASARKRFQEGSDLVGLGEAARIEPSLRGGETFTDDRAPVEWLVDASIVRYAADGRVTQAEKEFKAALGIEPQFAEARNNLGVLYGRQGRHVEAEKMLRQATEDSPQYVQAYVNLSLILAAEGQLAEAEQQAQNAIRLAPDESSALAALRMIRRQMSSGKL